MKILNRVPSAWDTTLLRIVAGGIMLSHGAARIYYRTVGGFGEFLTVEGFPAGTIIAWGLTIVEIIGGGALASGFYRRVLAVWFAIELLVGIYLVQLQHGWFVVGHGRNGMEYSVLLITVFLVIAAERRK